MAYFNKIMSLPFEMVVESYVSKFYSYENLHKIIKYNNVPVVIDTLVPDGYTKPPNKMKRSAGRPKTKRLQRRSKHLFSNDSRVRCGNCGEPGHNAATCERQNLPKEEWPNLDAFSSGEESGEESDIEEVEALENEEIIDEETLQTVDEETPTDIDMKSPPEISQLSVHGVEDNSDNEMDKKPAAVDIPTQDSTTVATLKAGEIEETKTVNVYEDKKPAAVGIPTQDSTTVATLKAGEIEETKSVNVYEA
jgi:hypothetical protein